jgi:Ca2+/Na+ antiporter
MAIGNSSPELFSCLISLFVTKSALGVGTAVGSAIFNHLCICAGSIFYAKDCTLYLDWRILTRECSIYLSSTVILVWSLKGNDFGAAFANAFNGIGSDNGDCLQVTWYQAVVLLLGYVVYVVVCSNFKFVSSLLCPLSLSEIAPREAIEEEISQSLHGKESLYIAENTIAGVNIKNVSLPSELIEIPAYRTMSFLGVIPDRQHPHGLHQPVPGKDAGDIENATESDPIIVSRHNSSDSALKPKPGTTSEPAATSTPVRGRTSSLDKGIIFSSPSQEDTGNEYTRGDTTILGGAQKAKYSHFSSADVRQDGRRGDEVMAFRRNTTTDMKLMMPRIVQVAEETTGAGEGKISAPHYQSFFFPRVVLPSDSPPNVEAHNREEKRSGERPASPLSTVVVTRQNSSGGVELRRMERIDSTKSDRPYFQRGDWFKCWMYKRSQLYSRHRVLSNQKWELRYFEYDSNGLRYARDDVANSPQKSIFNIYDLTDVWVSNMVNLEITCECGRSTFRLRCVTENDLKSVFECLRLEMAFVLHLSDKERKTMKKEAAARIKSQGKVVPHGGTSHNLLTCPDTTHGKIFHYLLYPIKFILYHTIPEIDHSQESESSKHYWGTIFSSVLWLAILSYIMNFCLEEMGLILSISPGAMGLTFGAAGTSIPNLLSSMIVARQGLGNMAVSNAFGSNIFCIYFVLGFGWTLYVIVTDAPYDGLKDSGIALTVIILLAVLVIFWVSAIVNKFVLGQWTAWLCLITYAGFLVFAFGWN